ncbi:MAG: hypothetical protein PHS97_00365 [Oscillospiraceae bacterium]|nr:hypothetical protein [Oscillospiraceae bacterium]
MQIQMRYVNGHVEVFTSAGRFLFSADSVFEAEQVLAEEEAA